MPKVSFEAIELNIYFFKNKYILSCRNFLLRSWKKKTHSFPQIKKKPFIEHYYDINDTNKFKK